MAPKLGVPSVCPSTAYAGGPARAAAAAALTSSAVTSLKDTKSAGAWAESEAARRVPEERELSSARVPSRVN